MKARWERAGSAPPPMNMEDWQSRQRALKKQERENKSASAQNLHGYRGRELKDEDMKLSTIKAEDRKGKQDAEYFLRYAATPELPQAQEQLMRQKAMKDAERKKKMESAEMLRSYRGGVLNEEETKLSAIRKEDRKGKEAAQRILRRLSGDPTTPRPLTPDAVAVIHKASPNPAQTTRFHAKLNSTLLAGAAGEPVATIQKTDQTGPASKTFVDPAEVFTPAAWEQKQRRTSKPQSLEYIAMETPQQIETETQPAAEFAPTSMPQIESVREVVSKLEVSHRAQNQLSKAEERSFGPIHTAEEPSVSLAQGKREEPTQDYQLTTMRHAEIDPIFVSLIPFHYGSANANREPVRRIILEIPRKAAVDSERVAGNAPKFLAAVPTTKVTSSNFTDPLSAQIRLLGGEFPTNLPESEDERADAQPKAPSAAKMNAETEKISTRESSPISHVDTIQANKQVPRENGKHVTPGPLYVDPVAVDIVVATRGGVSCCVGQAVAASKNFKPVLLQSKSTGKGKSAIGGKAKFSASLILLPLEGMCDPLLIQYQLLSESSRVAKRDTDDSGAETPAESHAVATNGSSNVEICQEAKAVQAADQSVPIAAQSEKQSEAAEAVDIGAKAADEPAAREGNASVELGNGERRLMHKPGELPTGSAGEMSNGENKAGTAPDNTKEQGAFEQKHSGGESIQPEQATTYTQKDIPGSSTNTEQDTQTNLDMQIEAESDVPHVLDASLEARQDEGGVNDKAIELIACSDLGLDMVAASQETKSVPLYQRVRDEAAQEPVSDKQAQVGRGEEIPAIMANEGEIDVRVLSSVGSEARCGIRLLNTTTDADAEAKVYSHDTERSTESNALANSENVITMRSSFDDESTPKSDQAVDSMFGVVGTDSLPLQQDTHFPADSGEVDTQAPTSWTTQIQSSEAEAKHAAAESPADVLPVASTSESLAAAPIATPREMAPPPPTPMPGISYAQALAHGEAKDQPTTLKTPILPDSDSPPLPLPTLEAIIEARNIEHLLCGAEHMPEDIGLEEALKSGDLGLFGKQSKETKGVSDPEPEIADEGEDEVVDPGASALRVPEKADQNRPKKTEAAVGKRDRTGWVQPTRAVAHPRESGDDKSSPAKKVVQEPPSAKGVAWQQLRTDEPSDSEDESSDNAHSADENIGREMKKPGSISRGTRVVSRKRKPKRKPKKKAEPVVESPEEIEEEEEDISDMKGKVGKTVKLFQRRHAYVVAGIIVAWGTYQFFKR